MLMHQPFGVNLRGISPVLGHSGTNLSLAAGWFNAPARLDISSFGTPNLYDAERNGQSHGRWHPPL